MTLPLGPPNSPPLWQLFLGLSHEEEREGRAGKLVAQGTPSRWAVGLGSRLTVFDPRA